MKNIRRNVPVLHVLPALFLLTLLFVTGCSKAQPAPATSAVSSEKEEAASGAAKEAASQESAAAASASSQDASKEETPEAADPDRLPALDFYLFDQFGHLHTLAEYEGKVIFLNFWMTWCPPCRQEMPSIQKLYEEYSADENAEVVILGVAGPGYANEGGENSVKNFLTENNYTYPVLMDTEGKLFQGYGIFSFPTTYMIDKQGNVFGYISGGLSETMMRNIIQQTLDG